MLQSLDATPFRFQGEFRYVVVVVVRVLCCVVFVVRYYNYLVAGLSSGKRVAAQDKSEKGESERERLRTCAPSFGATRQERMKEWLWGMMNPSGSPGMMWMKTV